MTWQTVMSALNTLAPPCCQAPTDEHEATILALRIDAGFGLPLVGTMLNSNLFDLSPESEGDSPEHHS